VLKFAELLKAADALGIKKVFTGHYVNLSCENGIYSLKKGADAAKDQSYFLYLLTQEELSRAGFPLGQLTKTQVREIAAAAGLPCAVRKDSQDACFQIPGECCGETLRRRCNISMRRGSFIHRGKTVGRHEGIHRYTLGQRNGLNVALGVPAYIKTIDPKSGNIELTTDQNELMSDSFTVKNLSWQSGNMPSEKLTVRVRYRSAGVPCTIEELPEGSYLIRPETSLRAVTPGQAAVFYAGYTLAGGGEIDHV
jgi:tRNA-specific 2-thiouridylase